MEEIKWKFAGVSDLQHLCVRSHARPCFSLVGILCCQSQDRSPLEHQLSGKLFCIVLKFHVLVRERLQII